MTKIIKTAKAPEPVGPYSQAVLAHSMLFCSGQISIDPENNQVELGSIKEQTTRVMKNIKALLNEANLDFENVVKTTIFLTSMSDFSQVNEVYASYFTKNFPARSTVAVSGLPKGVNVEIEVIAFQTA